jgi:hypothetical protein
MEYLASDQLFCSWQSHNNWFYTQSLFDIDVASTSKHIVQSIDLIDKDDSCPRLESRRANVELLW